MCSLNNEQQWVGGRRSWWERASGHSSKEEGGLSPADARKSEAGHLGEEEIEAEVARGHAWSEASANHSDCHPKTVKGC